MLLLLALQRLRYYGAMVEALERQLQGGTATRRHLHSWMAMCCLPSSSKASMELDQSPTGGKKRPLQRCPRDRCNGPGAWHSEMEVPKCRAMLAQPSIATTV